MYKRRISRTQLIDWFFTYGSSVEILFDDEDQERYEEFIFELLRNNNVEESFKEIFKWGDKEWLRF